MVSLVFSSLTGWRQLSLSGHSMVLDHTTKVLYIFSGQRDDKYLSDMYAYDIKTGISCEIFSNFSIAGGPEACFTPRAVIDTALKEIYVISGLTKANPPHTNSRDQIIEGSVEGPHAQLDIQIRQSTREVVSDSKDTGSTCEPEAHAKVRSSSGV
jgi:hypothetical protein